MTEKEKMIAGKGYFANDKQLATDRLGARELLFEFNQAAPKNFGQRKQLMKKLLGKTGNMFYLEPPFRCDYGYNIELGENFYANFNLVILDCAKVAIGHNVMFGPNVALYTAGHPLHHELRNSGLEWAQPIAIGNNVWLGGNVVVNPGVSIGDNTVVGSGSVVTKDLPAGVFAAGNPCRVIRPIGEEERTFYYKNLKAEE